MRSSPFSLLEADWLTAQPYAHRGLHGADAPENSRAAFAAAMTRGHGIELDVQASRWGLPFVFHDETLDRLTEEHGPLVEREADELASIRLRGGGETIPTLAEMLELVDRRVPVLIEVKAHGAAWHQLCYGVAASLESYSGAAAVMSFDPRVGAWFARHHPRIARGLVVTAQGKGRARGWAERLYSVWRARPHFIACDIRDLPSRFAARLRSSGMPVLTWTCRSDADRAKAALYADQIIYEDR